MVQQQGLPVSFQLLGWVGAPIQCGQSAEDLRFEQPLLRLAIQPLDPSLGRQRAPVQFEVELAGDIGQSVGGQAREECIDPPHSKSRKRREVLDARKVFEHPFRRTASAVSPAEGEKTLIVVGFASEIPPGSKGVVRDDVAIVAMTWIEKGVRRDAGAVDALPFEQIERKRIRLIPVEFDREKTVDPGAAQDLRQPARIPEHVGQPEHRVPGTEGRFEIALPIEKLPHERFAASDIRIRFDPGAADRFPAALPDALSHALE